MNNRRLLIAVLGVFFFAILVIVWYFYYAKPAVTPSLGETANPLPTLTTPPRFSFLTWGKDASATSTTEVTNPNEEPLVEVWDKGAVGNTFIAQDILKEVTATTTQGTSTIEIKKMVRASSTVLIFVDKTTGYVYGYPLETKKIYQISNTIVPGVYDAHFLNNGKKVIISYVDVEKNQTSSLVATVPSVPQDGEAQAFLDTTYLPSTVTSVTVNGRGDRVAYAVKTENGSTIYSLTPSGTTVVASSPFREWLLSYGGESLYAVTKASAYVPGVTALLPSFIARVDGKTGLLSNPGPSGDILSSMWSNSGLVTFLTKTGTDLVLSIRTLAPKCSWGETILICAVPRSLPKAVEGLPDDWYQGMVHFADDLIVVDPRDGSTYPFYTFSKDNGVFDVEHISILKTNDIISFTNRGDGSLWLLDTNKLGD